MKTKQFPDGKIELGWSGNNREPGYVGQAGAKSSVWYRINDSEWQPYLRSMHRLIDILECSDTVEEFIQFVGQNNDY